MHTYAKALTLRYGHYQDISDIDMAISRFGEALGCRLAGHTSRHDTLIELAEVLRRSFEVSHRVADVERAAVLLNEALGCLPD